MSKWKPDEAWTRDRVQTLRDAGVDDHMIGFRIGWDWAHERMMQKHTDIMLEMLQLHETEKQTMLAAWKAHHAMAMLHAKNAAALKPGAMACLLIVGFIAGGLLI